jgi:hypothetical protein
MKQGLLTVALVLAILSPVSASSWAGQNRIVVRAGNLNGRSGWVGGAVPVRRYFYAAPPYYYYVPGYYYQPYYPPVVVSPYSQPYYLPPTVVVTWPFFCALHNEGFVTRVGLLDHLAGTHKIPLEATPVFCPDGSGTCVFPLY